MQFFNQFFLIILVSLLSVSIVAQETEEFQKKDGSGFAGPDQVDRQLEEDSETKVSFFELGFMNPYFDFKKNLKENKGLNFGLDYTGAYFSANESLGLKDAGSGMVRLYGTWDLVDRGGENSGGLVTKIEHRHKYWEIPVVALASELGYIGAIEPTFNSEGFRLTNFYWRQRLLDGDLLFFVGLLDAADYLDVYMLASPWQHFTNLMFTTGSSTMYIPNDAALGIGVAAYLTKHLYVLGSLVDVNSNPTTPFKSFDTFFSKNDYFKSIEVGWVSSKERQFFDNIHLTYWNTDASEETASPKGWGLAFSSSWYFNNKWLPFVRAGYSEGANTLIQKSITAGFGYQPIAGGSMIGAAIGLGEPNEVTFEPGLDNQITLELFYRAQISTHIAISPDVQYLINPALNLNTSSIFVWGVRSRIAL